MGFLDRFKRPKPEAAEVPAPPTLSGGEELLRKFNEQAAQERANVVDLRPQKERDSEAQATQPLDGGDEPLADELVTLIHRFDQEFSSDRPASERTEQQIKAIGNQLCERAGRDHMVLVAYRGAFLARQRGVNVKVRDFEQHWDGICGWRW